MIQGIWEMTGHLALLEHGRQGGNVEVFPWRGYGYPCNGKCVFLSSDDYVCPLFFQNTSVSGTCIYYMILFSPEFITEISLISVPICSVPHSPLTFYSFPSILHLSGSLSPQIVSSHIDLSPSIVS